MSCTLIIIAKYKHKCIVLKLILNAFWWASSTVSDCAQGHFGDRLITNVKDQDLIKTKDGLQSM